MNSDNRQPDRLDALLSQARWPEPPVDSAARLAGAYRRARRVQLIVRWSIPLAAAAALAMIVLLSTAETQKRGRESFSPPVANGPANPREDRKDSRPLFVA